MKQEDFVDITQEIFINFIFTRENPQIDKNKAYSNQSNILFSDKCSCKSH